MITLIGPRCTDSNVLSRRVLIRRSSAGKHGKTHIVLGVLFMIKIKATTMDAFVEDIVLVI
jgi:hypothetical protein